MTPLFWSPEFSPTFHFHSLLHFFISSSFHSSLLQCLQAAIQSGSYKIYSKLNSNQFIMSDKNTSDKSAKSKGDAGRDARVKDSPAAAAVKSETTGSGSHSSPKKRRKVNHGELFTCACVCDRGSVSYWSFPPLCAVLRSPRGDFGDDLTPPRTCHGLTISLSFYSLRLLSSLGKPFNLKIYSCYIYISLRHPRISPSESSPLPVGGGNPFQEALWLTEDLVVAWDSI